MKRLQLLGILLGIAVLQLVLTSVGRTGEYRIPLMPKAPVVDGKIDPVEWRDTLRIDGFGRQGQLDRRRVSGYVGATATHLFFAIRSQMPDEGPLRADCTQGNENLVFDDSVEVWIDPTFGEPKGQRLQLIANTVNAVWSKLRPYGGAAAPTWQAAWPAKSSIHDKVWDYEVAVPLETVVAPGRRIDGGPWGLNLCRNWGWSSLGAQQYAPSDKFTFARDNALAISCEQRGDFAAGDVNAVLALHNTSAAPMTVKAQLLLERDIMPEINNSDTLVIPAGQAKEFPLAVKDTSTKVFKLTAKVTSADGAITHFDRVVSWQATGPWKWTTTAKVIPPLDFQYAYYPYLDTMRIRVDASNMPRDAVLATVVGTIRKKGGAPVKTVTFDQLNNGKQELTFSLPALNGEYEIALKATGKNAPAQEVVKPFERTVFAWEHNTLGKSTKVYPPFTPIRIDGTQVSTVLRTHEMGAGGLWNQVVAREQALLAEPMRWEATVNGATTPVTAGQLQFTKQAEHTAIAETGITAGDLAAKVLSTWDYDGTMRVDLTLQPSNGKTVEAFTLVIPLKDAQATYYHAMGDGIRNTLYDKVPAGDGVVWKASAVHANDTPKNFCTYIFVGTPVRGLCWFAENDKHWGWDPKTPNMELVREHGQLQMRIRLINRPEIIAQPRTITFGLLAAPVKPRVTPDWRHKYRRDNYSMLGTDINWLALGDCGSVYPANKDMYLWEMIKRGNRERLSDDEINKVIERGTPYFAPYGPEKVDGFVRHAWHNLRSRYGTKMIFYYNRASFQKAEEFETFKDEWCRTDYRTRDKGDGIGEISIVPSESYIDHAVYWYGKSFEIGGNQGVYWDNWFFGGTYNTMMTNAYTRQDGSMIASTGVWGLRELSKRTFQYMNELGMLPTTMPHMTSTNILPMHSFATLQYDWEWKYSEGDVQDRFSRAYIQMVTNGELAGTWPVLLSDMGKLADDPWTGRTFAAVCILHELDVRYAGWTETGKKQLALIAPIDEILAQPGVDAFRYWDDRPLPVKADNPDLPSIVYSVKGKQAVFAVVSYARKDEIANITIDPTVLSLTNNYKVIDTETGDEIPVTDNKCSFPLKKHDIKICKVVPK